MNRALALTVIAVAGLTAPCVAQSRQEPQLILSIGGGITASNDESWSVPRQELLVSSSSGMDTLALARRFRPGPVATLAATYHSSAHLGITAEAGYFGVATEMRCAPQGAYKVDLEHKNEQACTSAQGSHVPTSIVGFQAGLAYRFAWGPRVAPYVRASAGLGFLANSFVRTEGTVTASQSCGATGPACLWTLLAENETATMTWVGTLAAGASLSMGPGYRFRLEVRDLIVSLPVPSAPADPANRIASVGSSVRHIPVFSAGLDVVLERQRGRRY